MRACSSIWLAAAALTVALLVTGCSESSLGAWRVSKDEFIRQADQICLKADFAQPDEFEEFTTTHKEELGRLAPVPYEETVARDHIIPSIEGEIEELDALEPPASVRPEFETFIARWKAAVKAGEEDPYSIANFWVPAQDPLAPVNKAATRYGFEACNELR